MRPLLKGLGHRGAVVGAALLARAAGAASAQRAVFGILLSLEPAAAALAGLLVLGQVLRPTQLAGMALVVLASALVLGLGARKDPAEAART